MTIRQAAVRFWLITRREVQAHKSRYAISVSVIAVCAVLIVAVFATYGSITGSVRAFANSVSGNATLEVSAVADNGVDQAIADRVAAVPGVRLAAPIVTGSSGQGSDRVVIFGADQRMADVGSDLGDAVRAKVGEIGAMAALSGAIVGPGIAPGDSFRIGDSEVPIAGVVEGDAAQRINDGRFVVLSLAQAQKLLGKTGRVDSVLVVADAGADTAQLRAAIGSAVDGKAIVAEPQFRGDQADAATTLTRDSTLMVATISLVVAAFLVLNSMNLVVAQRRPQLAVMRAVGARRSVVVTDILIEAVVLGALGALIGIPIGVLVGRGMIDHLPPTLLQSIDVRTEFFLPWYAIPVAIVACVGATVVSAFMAARTAAKVAPVEAVGAAEDAPTPPNRTVNLVLAVLGFCLLAAAFAVSRTGTQTSTAAPPLCVGGVLALCVAFRRAITMVAGRVANLLGGPGRLASVAIDRAPRRAWATAMTVGIAVAVGIATSGAMGDLVQSSSDSLSTLDRADAYVSATDPALIPTGPILPDSTAEQVRRLPNVERVVEVQFAYVNLSDMRILVQGVEGDSVAPPFAAMDDKLRAQVLAGDGVVVSKELAKTLDLKPGDTLEIPTPAGSKSVRILAEANFLLPGSGLLMMSGTDLRQWFQRDGATVLEVFGTAGTDPADLVDDIGAVVPDDLEVYTGAEKLASVRGGIEQVGALAVAIQWVVGLVAAISVVNILTLSVLDRRRELGVFRAIGASSPFTGSIVVAEALAISVVGGAIGYAVGELLHFLVVQTLSVNSSFDVDFRWVVAPITYALGAAVLCVVGALIPAARVARMNVIAAITEA